VSGETECKPTARQKVDLMICLVVEAACGIIPAQRRHTMRYAKLAFVFLGLAAILVAAEPFAGTWKLNSAKTKYKTG